ncbi:hypothetical protein IQ07DRAFT_650386 [Pyrenochaeta sp. DS3sAY3a]|nr:hypothetical protein IQ07DRAFT_650386 [Pyrenochaeta sp. DS3sAY3a]
MPHQVKYADSESRALSPLPYRRDPSHTSRLPSAVIDLSSPPRPTRSAIPRERASEASRPQTLKSRRSDDEKRLVGDFRTPADAVDAPPAEVWMSNPGVGQVTMNRKPGSNSSFQPLNTFNDNHAGHIGRKPVTYSKQHRQYPPGIGQTRHPGQTAYLAQKQGHSAAASGNKYPSRDQHHGHDGSSAKRRKTGHVIDLDDDDEVLALGSPLPATSVPVSSKAPSFIKSSQPPRIAASASALNKGKQQGYGVSEFEATDNLANPRQKPVKTLGFMRHQESQPVSVSDAFRFRTKPPGSLTLVDDDEGGDRKTTARGKILESFQQGVADDAVGQSLLPPRRRDTSTSSHFPNARINESTSELPERSLVHTRDTADLHRGHLVKAQNSAEHESSEDELAISTKPETVRKKPTLVPQVETGSHSGGNRKKANRSKKGWPLRFARSLDLELHGSDTSDDLYDLVLRTDSTNARVVTYDRTDGVFETKIEIEPGAVVNVQGDGISRVRLQGPRGPDGNSPYFDLHFVKTPDYQAFCDNHATALAKSGKITQREVVYMTTLFSKPLHKNDKVGKSALVDAGSAVENDHDDSISTSRVPLWSRLVRPTTDVNRIPKQNLDSNGSSATMRTSTRPTRTTRSSMPKYDLDDVLETSTVEKFSRDVGLGPPWSKSLEYGEGRQRAVVHFDDLPRLDEEEFMNDSLIDFYMIYLFKKLNVPSDKVYFFNTYFFTQLTKTNGRNSINYAAVERWTSKIDIFTYDYIVVPINEATHWYLAIVCNVSNIARKPIIEQDGDSALDTQETYVGSSQDLNDKEKDPPTMDPSINLEEEPEETTHADLNLFDEESIRDHRDMTGDVQVEDSQDKDIPRSPIRVPEGTAQIIYDAEDVPTSILSRLKASPKKRKGKRTFTQPKKDPNVPVIIILDSLGATRSSTVRALKDWLAAEGAAKRGMEAVIKENGYYPKASQIPMQENWTDCGVYLLGYVEKFFQDPDDFKKKLLTAEMSSTEDWPELQPKEMRANMRQIICTIAEDQKVARKFERRAKKEAEKDALSGLGDNDNTEREEMKASKVEDLSYSKDTNKNEQVYEGTQSCKQSLAEPPRRRLATPCAVEESHITEPGAHLQDMEDVREISESPATVIPDAQPSPEVYSERRNRRKSPEVRILVKSPQLHSSANTKKMTTKAVIAEAEYIRSPKRTTQDEPKTRRNNPSNQEDNELRIPVSRSRSKLPRRSMKDFLESYAVKPRASREGSVGQPIMIEDSQDAEVTATQSLNADEDHVSVLRPRSPKVSSKNRIPAGSGMLKKPALQFQSEPNEVEGMDIDVYEYVDEAEGAQLVDDDLMEVDGTPNDAIVQETPQSSQTYF